MEKKRWTPNVHRVEIEICTACNLSCPNCDRSSPQARSREHMTVGQIRKFVDESIQLNWEWERITLLGGEPLLHPSLEQILSALNIYRLRNATTIFRMYSNGYGPVVARRARAMPDWIELRNTNKDPNRPPLFSKYNVAPVDCEDSRNEDFTKGCAVTSWCGLGLTRYGYYPCGAGASVDRVFGFDIGLKKLEDVTHPALANQLARLCALCGHFRDFDQREAYLATRDERVLVGWGRQQETSPTWERAYAAYEAKAPELSLY